MRTKKAAMEMSVGTIVTVVLLMTVLILGLVMVRTIFKSQTENINAIDDSVKSEIAKLFAEDDSKRVVAFPASGEVVIRKGTDNTGFGISIRNNREEGYYFGYETAFEDSNCAVTSEDAMDLMDIGSTLSGRYINSGEMMDSPIVVRLGVPEDFPICRLRYKITVKYSGQENALTAPLGIHDTLYMDLNIKSE